MGAQDFLERVLKHMDRGAGSGWSFQHWAQAGKVTDEGVGVLRVPGADAERAERILACVMDVDHYVGNLAHVEENRAVADDRFQPPEKVRFYQRIKIPVVGAIHHELVLERMGEVEGFQVAGWTMLEAETAQLGTRKGIRSQYNDGAWLVGDGVVAYALSSAPRRQDVGFLKWKALTKGADVGASKVVRDNIEAVVRWSGRR